MYAYCNNNPVNMIDSVGSWPSWNDLKSGLTNVFNWVDDHIVQPVVGFVEDVAEDFKNFDASNQSEEVVLESNYFSFYKGKLVLRTDLERSGSFGALFISRAENNRQNPQDTVRHEYGHTVQLEELGVIKYTLCIGLPSIFEWGSHTYYYDGVYEISADRYGGVQSRKHSEDQLNAAREYMWWSNRVGPLAWLLID